MGLKSDNLREYFMKLKVIILVFLSICEFSLAAPNNCPVNGIKVDADDMKNRAYGVFFVRDSRGNFEIRYGVRFPGTPCGASYSREVVINGLSDAELDQIDQATNGNSTLYVDNEKIYFQCTYKKSIFYFPKGEFKTIGDPTEIGRGCSF